MTRLLRVRAIHGGGSMESKDLRSMTEDELWNLYHVMIDVLREKITAERNRLEQQLLRIAGTTTKAERVRRRYPKVLPRYQNPDRPSQTWSGRGKKPRWFTEQLRSGKRNEDLRITQVRGAEKNQLA